MGKKDKVAPAEGAEAAPEYQAGVLAMARARMEASNADAEQGLAEVAAQTQRPPRPQRRRSTSDLSSKMTSADVGG